MQRIFYLTEKERRKHPETRRHEMYYRGPGHCTLCSRWAEFLDTGRDLYAQGFLAFPLTDSTEPEDRTHYHQHWSVEAGAFRPCWDNCPDPPDPVDS